MGKGKGRRKVLYDRGNGTWDGDCWTHFPA